VAHARIRAAATRRRQEFEFEGCDIFLGFHDGRLSHYQAAYDITDMMRQLEMLPPRGDRIGGAYFLALLQ